MKRLFALIVLSLCILTGCLTQDYFTVAGVTYHSKAEAINKLEQMNTIDLNGIHPRTEPYTAKALVAINTIERMEDTMSSYELGKNNTKRIYVEYLREFNFKTIKTHYDAIEKRNLFSETKFISIDRPEDVENPDFDYIIYLYNPYPNLAQWFIKGVGLPEPKIITMDNSKPAGAPRLMSWLDSIESTVSYNYTINGLSPPKTDKKAAILASYGTGFAVSRNVIVTAYHVIDGHEKISVKFEGGEWQPVKLHKYSKANDIAILSIDKNINDYLQLIDTKNLKQADRVFTMGYPATNILGLEPKYTEGYVSSLSGIQGENSLMQVSVPVQPGSSGGPLLNSNGNVVGLITSTAAVSSFYKFTGSLPQNINWAVKSDYIKLLIDYEPLGESKNINDAVSSAKKSICFIKAE